MCVRRLAEGLRSLWRRELGVELATIGCSDSKVAAPGPNSEFLPGVFACALPVPSATRASIRSVRLALFTPTVHRTPMPLKVLLSLPLSLGLLGALSIVRFRTPIKEPEEKCDP